jgi:hypothetical protein
MKLHKHRRHASRQVESDHRFQDREIGLDLGNRFSQAATDAAALRAFASSASASLNRDAATKSGEDRGETALRLMSPGSE